MPRQSDLIKQEKRRRALFMGHFFDCRSAPNEQRKNRAIEEMAKLAKTFEEWSYIHIWATPGSEPAKRAIKEMLIISGQAA